MTVFGAAVAAICYMAYMANGIAASALIGLRGREHDIASAQYKAGMLLFGSAIFEVGVILGFFSLLQIGTETGALPRFILRGSTAILLSLAGTVLAGLVLFGFARVVHP
jgi:hypothetical protein